MTGPRISTPYPASSVAASSLETIVSPLADQPTPGPECAGPGGHVRGLAARGEADRGRRVGVGRERGVGQNDDVEDQIADRAHGQRPYSRSGCAPGLHVDMITSVASAQQRFLLSEQVAGALRDGMPVVALESTIITHGLPRRENVQAALEFEQTVSDAGAVPATIAVLDGVVHVGLATDELERLAGAAGALKLSARDLPVALAPRSDAAARRSPPRLSSPRGPASAYSPPAGSAASTATPEPPSTNRPTSGSSGAAGSRSSRAGSSRSSTSAPRSNAWRPSG